MNSIIYDESTRRFSIGTRMFGKGGYSIDSAEFHALSKQQQEEWKKANKEKQKQLIEKWGIKNYTEKSGGKDKNNNNKGNKNNNNNNNNDDKDGSNYYTKKSPKVYAYEKLLLKNLNELKGQGRVVDWRKLGDNYSIETPNDIWLNVYITADGNYIITKLDMGDGGYFGKNRRFNAIVAGPKELRDIISSARELEDASTLTRLKYKFISLLTGTDI